MDISGSAGFGLGANVPFSTAHFDEADAGAGAFQFLRSGIQGALQAHMNTAVQATPDARDFLRSWSVQLSETLLKAEADIVNFLEEEASEVPCVERHRNFLRGLDTPGFVTSTAWVSRNLRSVVDHEAVLADISGALGMSVATFRDTVRSAMELYLPSIEAMDATYKRLQARLTNIETTTKQVFALRIPNRETTPEFLDLQSALLRYIESQYAAMRIEDDYIEFCTQYDRFQTYRSILSLMQPRPTQPTCVVCMTEPVSAAVIPCGHTFCSRCCGTQRGTCYICRTPVRERQRLYF